MGSEEISFKEKKELIELRHSLSMKELETIRENDKLKYNDMLSLHRLKRADRRNEIATREQFKH